MGLTQKLGTIPLAILTDSSNNVGIGGAASGSFKLQVTGTSNLTGALTGTSATFSSSVTSSLGSGGANFNSNAATTGSVNAYRVSNTTGTASFGIDNSTGGDLITGGLPYATLLQSISNTALQLGTNQTARLTITSGGNVGIGTTSPNDLLEIKSTTANQANVRLYNTFNDGSNVYGISWFRNYDSATNSQACFINYVREGGSGGYMSFGTGTVGSIAEKMRITSGGFVCIGATSAINGSTFYAQGNSTQAGEFYTNGPVGTAALLVEKSPNDSSTSQVYIRFLHNNGGAGAGQINGNGASSAAFGSYSDEGLKENITNLPNQVSNILALRPVEFDYIESEGGGHQIGFIAQEMKNVYPDVVGVREDEMLTITGWSKTEARLVKAIQELNQIVIELQERIKQLENK